MFLDHLMTTLHFIGVAIPAKEDIDELLNTEFTDSVIHWVKHNSMYCLFYKERSIFTDTQTLKIDDNQRIALSESQIQHLIGTLKRVRSDKLYSMYPDDFGVKHIGIGKRQVIVMKSKALQAQM